MPTLLHIDSSLNGATSVSREVARTFRETWEAENPGGTVVYRDLNAEPLPHLDAVSYYSASIAAEERTPEQQQAYELRDKLASELESADAVLGQREPFHIHFSDIAYANRNETKHLPYGEGTLRADPLAEALRRFERPATVISESPDEASSQAIRAALVA